MDRFSVQGGLPSAQIIIHVNKARCFPETATTDRHLQWRRNMCLSERGAVRYANFGLKRVSEFIENRNRS